MTNFEEKIDELKKSRITLDGLESISSEINRSALSPEDKNRLYLALENAAFIAGIEFHIDQLEVPPLQNLTATTEVVDATVQIDTKISAESEILSSEAKKSTDELNRLIGEFASVFDSKARALLLNYKKFFIFKIGKKSLDFKTNLIHDNIPMPEVAKKSLKGFSTMMSLNDFMNELVSDKKGGIFRAETNLILLLSSDFSSETQKLLAYKEIFEGFELFKFYELSLDDDYAKPYEYEGERFFTDLESDLNISLSNAELSKSEESLIKSFFPAVPSSIQYKLLKGGFSGSKVIEVSQTFSTAKPCRFVIKIDLKKNRKIAIEEKAVKQWVSSLVNQYQTEKKENATHEALKYQFASSDGKRESISFSQYFKEKSVAEIEKIIDFLFDDQLFGEWEKMQFKEDKRITVSNLFKEFVDWPNIEKVVERIAFTYVDSDKNVFKNILNSELAAYVVKVCHGDLHSENIIIDQNQVFLIDFGLTGSHPCFLDYATLETSIRLSLTPNYLPSNILEQADEQFLFKFDAIDATIESKITDRELRKSYQIISKIRSKAIHKVRGDTESYNSNSDLEINYLLSLFCLMLRNLKYSDLNQKYAIRLARKIAEHLQIKLGQA